MPSAVTVEPALSFISSAALQRASKGLEMRAAFAHNRACRPSICTERVSEPATSTANLIKRLKILKTAKIILNASKLTCNRHSSFHRQNQPCGFLYRCWHVYCNFNLNPSALVHHPRIYDYAACCL